MAETEIRRRGFRWAQIRVAILIVASLALLVFAVYKVGQVFDIFADRYELVTVVSNASGLISGAPVTLAGQRVGQIEEIQFIPVEEATGENHLTIRFSVDRDVQDQIRANSSAQIRTQGLLGDKLMNIEPGTPAAPVLMQNDTLPSETPVDYEEVLARAATMLDDAQIIVDNMMEVSGALARGEGALGRLVTDDALYERVVVTTAELGETLRTINVSDGTFGRLVRDPELYDRLNAAVAGLDTLTTTLASGEGTLGRLTRSDSLYNNLVSTVEQADSALAQIEGVAAQVNSGDGTVQRLLRDPAMYDELLKAVVDLQNLLEDIRQNPDNYSPRVDVF